MAELNIKITVNAPLHLGSGQADVNIDAEIVHDSYGLPYFPAKRFKGLLYESAVEVYEIFQLAEMSTENLAEPEKVFHRFSDDDGKVSEVQIVVPNFYIRPLEEYQKICEDWKYLQSEYREIFSPADVLKNFTAIRYQTKLENGIAADRSLHNLNVLHAGENFFGKVEIMNFNDKILNLNGRMTYTNEKYDTTMIEIKEEDGINNFMELDDRIINDIINNKNQIEQYDEETIYIIHYPEGQLSVSYGIISGIFANEIERYNFHHKCHTRKGSSGSPVLNLKNKIIGIHKEGLNDKNYNQGTF